MMHRHIMKLMSVVHALGMCRKVRGAIDQSQPPYCTPYVASTYSPDGMTLRDGSIVAVRP
jgi:hypothetical protein